VSTDSDKNLATIYGLRLAAKANEFYTTGDFHTASYLYEKALTMPMDKSKPDLYFNLSLCYKLALDKNNELRNLKKVLEIKPDFLPAILEAGIVYYGEKLFPLARDMFEKAKELDTNKTNADLIEKSMKSIDSVDTGMQYEQIMKEATDLLAKENNYERAMELFNFLINKKYHPEQIYENIGVYYFKKNNFEESLKYYEKSKACSPTAKIYKYIAYNYYKLNYLDKALNVLNEGMKIYSGDEQMLQLYNQLNHIKGTKGAH